MADKERETLKQVLREDVSLKKGSLPRFLKKLVRDMAIGDHEGQADLKHIGNVQRERQPDALWQVQQHEQR